MSGRKGKRVGFCQCADGSLREGIPTSAEGEAGRKSYSSLVCTCSERVLLMRRRQLQVVESIRRSGRRSSYHRPSATPQKGRALRHRADGDGRRRNAEKRLDEGQDRRSSYYRPRATPRKEWPLQHRADGKARKWKAHALQRTIITVMPAMHRGSSAPDWGGSNGREPRMKGGSVSHNTPGRRRGTEEQNAHAVTGLVPGCPLCADDGLASDRGGATASGARVGSS